MALVVLAFLLATTAWIRRDNVPPLWDSAVYLQHSTILYRSLARDGILAFLVSFSHSMTPKAPLISALPIPFYMVLGESHLAARSVNLAWIVLSSIYLFRLGRMVASDAAGLLAVVAINTFPLVAGMSRQYLVEYGLMTMVILWIYYLLRWQRGDAESAPWILGVLLGFGLLLKVTLPLYVAAPTALVLWQRISHGRGIRGLLSDLMPMALVALPIAALWYAGNLGGILRFVISGGFGEVGRPYGTGPVFSLQTIGRYWLNLINLGVSVYYFALLALVLAGCCFTLWKRGTIRRSLFARRDLHLLFAWWLIPWLALTLAVNKEPRYAVPYLPALAVLLAVGLAGIVSRPRRLAAFVLVGTLGLFNYVYYSFAARWLDTEQRLGALILVSGNLGWARPPLTEVWPDEEVLRVVAEDARNLGSQRARVRVLFSHPHLNAHVLNYLATLHELSPRFATVHFQTPGPLEDLIAAIHSEFDYLLVKSELPGPQMLNVRNLEVVSALKGGALRFEPISALSLPDGSFVTVYRRSPPESGSLPRSPTPGSSD